MGDLAPRALIKTDIVQSIVRQPGVPFDRSGRRPARRLAGQFGHGFALPVEMEGNYRTAGWQAKRTIAYEDIRFGASSGRVLFHPAAAAHPIVIA